MAEVIPLRRGNVPDGLDAAEEFFFAAKAVAPEHDLRRPGTLHSEIGQQKKVAACKDLR
jgi:hypothetical protein